MSIKKFFATEDTTITDAFKLDNTNRATTSNMGASDSLEVFFLSGAVSQTSLERSRILIKFPIDEISSSRAEGKIPVSGNVNFFLNLYNVKHPLTLPKNYYLRLAPVSASWQEGYGLDMESYTDIGATGSSGVGANWLWAASNVTWSVQGGDFLNSYNYQYYIKNGDEDVNLDITALVEAQVANSLPNYGLGVMMSGAYESSASAQSFYTKKFSARGTEFFFKRPSIEARWDSSNFDDRSNFFKESNVLSQADNTNYLYMYNRVKGSPKNINGNPSLTVKFYSDAAAQNQLSASYLSTENPATGTYKASVVLNTTASVVYDYWVNASATGTIYFSSSFEVLQRDVVDYNYEPAYVFSISNLKTSYKKDENTRFKIYSREKDWSPNVYAVAQYVPENVLHKNLYYRIFRIVDGLTILDYGTGSIPYTLTSHDKNGNYFDLDMNILEPDYSYGVKLMLLENANMKEQKEVFKFKVES